MDTLKLIAVSDIHERLDHLPGLAEGIAGADLVLILGDLTQFGRRREAARVLDAFRRINPNILAVPGNLDHPEVLDFLIEQGVSLHGVHTMHGEIGLAGIGGSNPTPFNTPLELAEGAIYEILSEAVRGIAGARWRIVVSHAPPRQTKVDRIRFGIHAGSSSVRRIVEEFQPHLLLCGHIHEAAGEDLLGETRLLNPGPFSRGGHIWIEASAEALIAEIRFPRKP